MKVCLRLQKATRPDVDNARSDLAIAKVGLLEAEQAVFQRKLVLGELLSMSPDQAEQLELRGTIGDLRPRWRQSTS